MRLVYNQEYTKGDAIKCWYGKPPRGVYKYDVIRLRIGKKDDIYITPHEASTIIRALSAGLSHLLVNEFYCKSKKGVKNKKKEEVFHEGDCISQ